MDNNFFKLIYLYQQFKFNINYKVYLRPIYQFLHSLFELWENIKSTYYKMKISVKIDCLTVNTP